jgi:16S rRNA (adenine1518-N6/adenine1519-N6)-dimethyltransferase
VTYSKSQLNALFDSHRIRPKRSLGQNFVVDANTVRKIAYLSGVGANDHVIEVGAGAGSLSLALLETGAQLVCVEVDESLVEILQENVVSRGAEVVTGDAMDLDWDELLSQASEWVLVANLPYNIATPLICDLLDKQPKIKKFVVMVQREVADRLVANAGSSDYGSVSVKVDYWASRKKVAVVPPTVFVPKPKVESAVVVLERRAEPLVSGSDVPAEHLFSLVQRAFNQRRKQLQKSLRAIVGNEDFVCAGVSPSARPQELNVIEWGKLAACNYRHSQN